MVSRKAIAGFFLIGLIAVFLLAADQAPRRQPDDPAKTATVWEYRSIIAYNAGPSQNPDVRTFQVSNLIGNLEAAGVQGWEVAGMTTISGIPSPDARASAEKIVVLLKRRKS